MAADALNKEFAKCNSSFLSLTDGLAVNLEMAKKVLEQARNLGLAKGQISGNLILIQQINVAREEAERIKFELANASFRMQPLQQQIEEGIASLSDMEENVVTLQSKLKMAPNVDLSKVSVSDPDVASQIRELNQQQQAASDKAKLLYDQIASLRAVKQKLQDSIEANRANLSKVQFKITTAQANLSKLQDKVNVGNSVLQSSTAALSTDIANKYSLQRSIMDAQATFLKAKEQQDLLTSQMRSLKSMQSALREQYNDSQAKIDATRKNISVAQANVDLYKQQLQENATRMEALMKKQGASDTEMVSAVNSSKALAFKLAAVQSDLGNLRDVKAAVQNQLDDLNKIKANLESQIKKAESKKTEAEEKIKNLIAQEKEQQATMKELEHEFAVLQEAEKEAIKNSASAVQQQALLKSQLNVLTDQQKILQDEVDGLELQKATLQRDLEKKTGEETQASKESERLTAQIAKLEATQSEQASKTSENIESLKTLTKSNANAATRLTQTNESIKGLVAQQQTLNTEIKKLNETISSLRSDMKKNDASYMDTQSKLKKTEADVEKITADIQKQSDKIVELEKEQSKLNASNVTAKQKMDLLKEEKKLIEDQKKSTDLLVKSLNQSILELQPKVAAINNDTLPDMKANEAQVDKLTAELTALQNSLKSAQDEVSAADKAKVDNKTMVEVLQKALSAAVSEQKRVNDVITSLQRNVELLVEGQWGSHKFWYHPFTAADMARMQFEYGGSSTYTPLPDQPLDKLQFTYRTISNGPSCSMLTAEMICKNVTSTACSYIDQPPVISNSSKVVMCTSNYIQGSNEMGIYTVDRIVSSKSGSGCIFSGEIPVFKYRKGTTNGGQYGTFVCGMFISCTMDPDQSNSCVLVAVSAFDEMFPNKPARVLVSSGSMNTCISAGQNGTSLLNPKDSIFVQLSCCNGISSISVREKPSDPWIVTPMPNIIYNSITYCGMFVLNPSVPYNYCTMFNNIDVQVINACSPFIPTTSYSIYTPAFSGPWGWSFGVPANTPLTSGTKITVADGNGQTPFVIIPVDPRNNTFTIKPADTASSNPSLVLSAVSINNTDAPSAFASPAVNPLNWTPALLTDGHTWSIRPTTLTGSTIPIFTIASSVNPHVYLSYTSKSFLSTDPGKFFIKMK